MLVPKTTVHKDHFSAGGEYNVGAAGELSPMQPETVAQPVQLGAHDQFGFSILASDSPHVFAAASTRDRIHRAMNALRAWGIS